MTSIFIIDDDPMDLNLLESAIKHLNKSAFVCKAFSGNQAVDVLKEQFQEQDFDILITDYDMPGMTGVDVINTLSTDIRFKNSKKIILSAIAPFIHSKHEKTIAGTELFQKPDDLSEYESIVGTILADA